MPSAGASDSAGCARGGARVDGEHRLIGSPAPAFDLAAQSGGPRASLAQLQGKVTIVDFWATWCEPCRASFPKYQALLDEFGDRLAVVAISVDEDASGIQAFAKETGAKFLLAWDEGQRLAGTYEPGSMPTSYIIDRNGLVRAVHPGYREGDEVAIRNTVCSLLE